MELQQAPYEQYLATLVDTASSVTSKYMAIFQLKQDGTTDAVRALLRAFKGDAIAGSELLKHEITYALGQMSLERDDEVVAFLRAIVLDEGEYPVVRHEAGEALSNYASNEALHAGLLDLFGQYARADGKAVPSEVRDTSVLGEQKVLTFGALSQQYALNYSGTREPAAPFTADEFCATTGVASADFAPQGRLPKYTAVLEYIYASDTPLFQRYRALYFLRDLATQHRSREICEAVASLLNKANRAQTNQLFRHEVCFVLGQLSEWGRDCAVETQLRETIADEDENEIVRHEAISGFSSFSQDKAFIEKFRDHTSRIVRESAIVALDMVDYWG